MMPASIMLASPLLVALLAGPAGVLALDNGFGRTPVMSFNAYNVAGCTINQTFAREYINSFADQRFPDFGYKQFGLDCGWQGRTRQQNGSIDWDRELFPDGIKPLSDLARSRGMQWGMYTDQGKFSCDTQTPLRQGSLGFERQDALQFAAWNTVYMKVDNCYIEGPQENAPKRPRTDFPSRFQVMQNALASVGIKGMLVCQWGVPWLDQNQLFGPSFGTPALSTSYRVSDDIARGWNNVMRIYNQNIHICQNDLTGPGRFSDMDMLEVGNPGMTLAEQASHFAVWAFMKSPSVIGTRLPGLSNEVRAILQNRGIIAINQDPLGKPVKLRQRFNNDNDAFSGPLSNGDLAILLVDQSNRARNLFLELGDYDISSATVTNLWTGEVRNNVNRYDTNIEAHGSIPLRVSNIVRRSAQAPQLRWYEAEAGRVAGATNVQPCSGCSGGFKVGNVGNGNGNTLTFTDVRTSRETQDVRFDYITCELGYLFDGGFGNVRGASISVNGRPGTSVIFPLTGYEWTKDVYKNFQVRLSGFNTQGSNTITISGLSEVSPFAPDFDRVGVVA